MPTIYSEMCVLSLCRQGSNVCEQEGRVAELPDPTTQLHNALPKSQDVTNWEIFECELFVQHTSSVSGCCRDEVHAEMGNTCTQEQGMAELAKVTPQ